MKIHPATFKICVSCKHASPTTMGDVDCSVHEESFFYSHFACEFYEVDGDFMDDYLKHPDEDYERLVRRFI